MTNFLNAAARVSPAGMAVYTIKAIERAIAKRAQQ